MVTYKKEVPSVSHMSLLSLGLVKDLDFSYTICRFETQMPQSSLTSCLNCITNPFLLNSKFYNYINGVAMGSPFTFGFVGFHKTKYLHGYNFIKSKFH